MNTETALPGAGALHAAAAGRNAPDAAHVDTA